MLRKIIVLLALVSIVFIVFSNFITYYLDQAENSKVILAQVDEVQDIRVTGYPDSRKVAVDSKGNIYTAYRKAFRLHQTTQYHIFVARSSDSGHTWQILNNDRPVENVGDYNQRVPSIVIDNQDAIHVVWYGNDEQNNGKNERQIKYVRSTDRGETWSDWRNLVVIRGYEDDELWQEHPVIYAHNSVLYVVWQGRDSDYQTSQTRFVRSFDAGQSWSAASIIRPDPTTNFSRPSLVADHNGSISVLAYSAMQGVQQIVWCRSQDEGVTWTAWESVAAGEMDQRHLSAVVDYQASIHVVWRQLPAADRKLSRIYYAVFNGRSWTDSVLISPATSGHQYFPSAAFDKNGNLFVAWMETTEEFGFPNEKPANGNIFYSVKTGTGWSERQQLTTGGHALYPSLMSVEGSIAAVWLERVDNTVGKILYGTLRFPEVKEK